MQSIDTDVLKDISKIIIKNKDIVQGSNSQNKIRMEGNKINLISNGNLFYSYSFNSEYILDIARQMPYNKINIDKIEKKISPLEADRKNLVIKEVWRNPPETITLPYFTSTYFLLVAFSQTIPTMFDLRLLYEITYLKEIGIENKDPNRINAYSLKYKDIALNDRQWLGEKAIIDGVEEENRLLMYKSDFDTKNLPIYDFTTRQLNNRIYKIYGSNSRDFTNVLVFDRLGAEAIFDSFLDSQGGDLNLNSLKVASFTNTESSRNLRIDKVENRHRKDTDADIELIFDIDFNCNKVNILDDNVAAYILKQIEEYKRLNINQTISLRTEHIKEMLNLDLSGFNGFNLN